MQLQCALLQQERMKVVNKHKKDLADKRFGDLLRKQVRVCVVFYRCCAVLYYAVLCCAVLSCVELWCGVLCCIVLCCVVYGAYYVLRSSI